MTLARSTKDDRPSRCKAVTLSLRIPSGHVRPMCQSSPSGHVAVTTQPSGQTDPPSYVYFVPLFSCLPFRLASLCLTKPTKDNKPLIVTLTRGQRYRRGEELGRKGGEEERRKEGGEEGRKRGRKGKRRERGKGGKRRGRKEERGEGGEKVGFRGQSEGNEMRRKGRENERRRGEEKITRG